MSIIKVDYGEVGGGNIEVKAETKAAGATYTYPMTNGSITVLTPNGENIGCFGYVVDGVATIPQGGIYAVLSYNATNKEWSVTLSREYTIYYAGV